MSSHESSKFTVNITGGVVFFSSSENPSCVRIFQDGSAVIQEKGMNTTKKVLKTTPIPTSDSSKVSTEVKKKNIAETETSNRNKKRRLTLSDLE